MLYAVNRNNNRITRKLLSKGLIRLILLGKKITLSKNVRKVNKPRFSLFYFMIKSKPHVAVL